MIIQLKQSSYRVFLKQVLSLIYQIKHIEQAYSIWAYIYDHEMKDNNNNNKSHYVIGSALL